MLIDFDTQYKAICQGNVIKADLKDFGIHYFIVLGKNTDGILTTCAVTYSPEKSFHHKNYHESFYFIKKSDYEEFTVETLVSFLDLHFIPISKIKEIYDSGKLVSKNDFPEKLFNDILSLILQNEEEIEQEYIEMIKNAF